jgi:LCP family protein required for cell wall assembly
VPARPVARPASGGRYMVVGAKAVLGVVSALVLAATGYYWSRLASFADDVTTVDVIAGGAEDSGPPIDGAVDILLVGMDSRTDPQGNPLSKEQLAMLNAGEADGVQNTDTIILVHIPVEGGKAMGISIPRDSYVDIPGYGQHKINSAYLRKRNDAMADLRAQGVTGGELTVRSNQEGAKSLIATVQQLTGVTVDHYAEINLLGFYDITLAIGGIDVCLKKPVKDRDSGADFPAGPQNLSGAPALSFVRQRKGLPRGDIDRVSRQQVFLSGMAKKAFSGNLLAPGSDTMDKLQQAVAKSVVLDKGWNIMDFAQQIVEFTGGNLTFETIPVGRLNLPTPSDGKAVEVDPAAVRDFVRGIIPDDTTPTPGAPAPASVTVNVLNTTEVAGLAANVADTLTAKGFTLGRVGNDAALDTTVVRHAPGERAAGDLVAQMLSGPARVEEDKALRPGQVTVLLGRDYPTGDHLTRPGLVDLGPAPARQPATGAPPVGDGTCVN